MTQLALSQRSHVPSGTALFAATNASPAEIALVTADFADRTISLWFSLICLANAGRSTGARTSAVFATSFMVRSQFRWCCYERAQRPIIRDRFADRGRGRQVSRISVHRPSNGGAQASASIVQAERLRRVGSVIRPL